MEEQRTGTTNPYIEGELTVKQEEFCRHYVRTKNATRAAKLAGYAEGTARQMGSENLTKPVILARVGELTVEMSQASYIDAEKVIRNLAVLANSDVRRLYDEDGNLLPVNEWDDDTAYAVQSLEVEEKKFMGVKVSDVKKVKLVDKKGANVELAKHFGLYREDNKQRQTIVFGLDAEDADL